MGESRESKMIRAQKPVDCFTFSSSSICSGEKSLFGHFEITIITRFSSPVELQVFSGPVQKVQEPVHYFILTHTLQKDMKTKQSANCTIKWDAS